MISAVDGIILHQPANIPAIREIKRYVLIELENNELFNNIELLFPNTFYAA